MLITYDGNIGKCFFLFILKDAMIVINYMVEAMVVFKCPIDYSHFPFHSATCNLKITSFTQSNISMVFHSMQWSDYVVKTRGYKVGVSYLTGKDTVELAWNGTRKGGSLLWD